MLRKTFVFFVACGLPCAALAQALGQADSNFRCTLGGNVRRVEIAYEGGASVPCEVRYFKDTEAPGEPQVLWNARNESGYCEARTREFVSRLESLGWECTAAAGGASAGSDDTDVLGAGESQN